MLSADVLPADSKMIERLVWITLRRGGLGAALARREARRDAWRLPGEGGFAELDIPIGSSRATGSHAASPGSSIILHLTSCQAKFGLLRTQVVRLSLDERTAGEIVCIISQLACTVAAPSPLVVTIRARWSVRKGRASVPPFLSHAPRTVDDCSFRAMFTVCRTYNICCAVIRPLPTGASVIVAAHRSCRVPHI
jgi:hypothetical protein